MTKIICPLSDCGNWDEGMCGAETIRLSEEGYCLTYEEVGQIEAEAVEEDWDDEDIDLDLDEDDDWLDEDELDEDEDEDEDWGDDVDDDDVSNW
ncbi:MAG: hypothetical protein HZY76_09750 [Anaerolineae bacterium]|nr:MAG: hypothetical protein HZY76_09750 [Anaerolineae bacterium]